VAQQTGIWTFLLSKSLGHASIGNIVDLMSSGSKKNSVHDSGHVTRDAPAALGVDPVMSVRRESGAVLKLGVAVGAHQVRPITKL
jgi:hypothetical protein